MSIQKIPIKCVMNFNVRLGIVKQSFVFKFLTIRLNFLSNNLAINFLK